MKLSSPQSPIGLLLSLAFCLHCNGENLSRFPDILHLKNGSRVSCIIHGIDNDRLDIEYPTSTGSGVLKRQVPWKELHHVEFHMDEKFLNLLKQDPSTVSSDLLHQLEAQWNLHQHRLGYPQHPVGELGVLFIKACLSSSDETWLNKALDMIQQVSTRDWDPNRRSAADMLKLEALDALDQREELRALAKERLSSSSTPSNHRAAIHLLLARLDHEELSKLENDNPRWADDDIVRPQREALFHRLLDHCLMPSLFEGSSIPQAAEGLALAQQIHFQSKNIPQAANYARDLIHLYPDTPQASQAAEFLKQHRLSITPTEFDDEQTPSTDTSNEGGNDQEIRRRKRYAPSDQSRLKRQSLSEQTFTND